MTQAKLYLPIDKVNIDFVRTRVKDYLALAFGGYTMYEARGGWHNGKEIVEDKVEVYESYHDNFNAVHENMEWLAERVYEYTDEDSIMYTVNDQAFFVEEY